MFFGEDGETLDWLGTPGETGVGSPVQGYLAGIESPAENASPPHVRGSLDAGGSDRGARAGGGDDAQGTPTDEAEESFLAGLRAIAVPPETLDPNPQPLNPKP